MVIKSHTYIVKLKFLANYQISDFNLYLHHKAF